MRIAKKILKIFLYIVLVVLGLILATCVIVSLITTPSNDREWNTDQEVLPYAEISDNLVTIHNVRNFSYTSTTEYTPAYYDKTYDLEEIKRAWYVVEPFSGIPGSAHTFLSFEFEDDEFVSISIEIRKEKNEAFHPIKGLFNQYELMYVIADERDAIKLRSNYRKDLVYVYPIKAGPDKVRELFLGMVERTNELAENPEFYNTLVNTCATNIVEHVNEITPDKVPFFNLRILLPANSDQLAYELGLIDTELSFEEARARYFINERALKYTDSEDFSVKIREEEK